MHWQEIVLALGQVIFIIALLPSILSKDKPEIWTSVLTGSVALSVAITYLTLHIPLAALFAFLNFIAWAILAIQVYLKPRISPVKHRHKRQSKRQAPKSSRTL